MSDKSHGSHTLEASKPRVMTQFPLKQTWDTLIISYKRGFCSVFLPSQAVCIQQHLLQNLVSRIDSVFHVYFIILAFIYVIIISPHSTIYENKNVLVYIKFSDPSHENISSSISTFLAVVLGTFIGLYLMWGDSLFQGKAQFTNPCASHTWMLLHSTPGVFGVFLKLPILDFICVETSFRVFSN